MNKQNVQNSGNISTGELHTYEFDLSNKDFSRQIAIDCLGFTTAGISISCINATATSGNATVQQSNNKFDNGFPITAGAVTVALGVDTNNAVFDVKVSGAYLHIALPGTLGSQGKVKVAVTIKR